MVREPVLYVVVVAGVVVGCAGGAVAGVVVGCAGGVVVGVVAVWGAVNIAADSVGVFGDALRVVDTQGVLGTVQVSVVDYEMSLHSHFLLLTSTD